MNTQNLAGVWANTLLTPDHVLHQAALAFADGQIGSITPDTPVCPPGFLDAGDRIVIPGLVDLQVNGALGYSFQTQDRAHFDAAVAYHLQRGTTTLLPTLVTAPESVLIDSLRTLSDYLSNQHTGCTLPGIHLEGPFLAPAKRGAHDANALRAPDDALMQQFVAAAAHRIRLTTLAPELPGSLALIKQLVAQHIVVSAGHTEATFAQMQSAVDAGLSMITHASNASDWPHRSLNALGFMGNEPGVVGALMALPALCAGIILDGFHFHPALLPPLLKIKGDHGLFLVSDASTVAGCPPGDYKGGGLMARVDARGFATSLRGGNVLAGSTITLLDAVQRAVSLAGLSLQQAVMLASASPAAAVGLAHRKGTLQVGADADLLLLNPDITVHTVITAGSVVDRGCSTQS